MIEIGREIILLARGEEDTEDTIVYKIYYRDDGEIVEKYEIHGEEFETEEELLEHLRENKYVYIKRVQEYWDEL